MLRKNTGGSHVTLQEDGVCTVYCKALPPFPTLCFTALSLTLVWNSFSQKAGCLERSGRLRVGGGAPKHTYTARTTSMQKD
jgi:hypothetical protein